MIPNEVIVAFSMGLTEVIRKSNPEVKNYSVVIALGISLVISIISSVMGGLDMPSNLADTFTKAIVALGLFAGGTAIGTKINS